MKCLLAIFSLIFVCVNAKSLPTDSTWVNPCTPDALYVLKYYQPYTLDETKYVECNPWGFYTIRQCDTGFKWNSWLMSCVRIITPEIMPTMKPSKPMEPPMPLHMPNITTNETFCTYFGNYTCKNGGICSIFLDGFSKCSCLSNFTGRYCEIVDPKSKGLFGELINSTFSLDMYKKQRPLLNDSIDFNMTIDTSIQWDDVTKQKIAKYIELFPNGSLRFDVLINYLVEDFVGQLYPTSFYLQEFNYPTELQTGLSGAIPSLLLTSKYTYDTFAQFMVLYEDVLDNLVDYLALNQKLIQQQAQMFYEVYDQIFKVMESKKTTGVTPTTEDKTGLTREEMVTKILTDYNVTLAKSYELFKIANKFDDDLALKAENYTTEEIVYAIGNFSMSTDVIRLMTDIHTTNSDIWDSLSFYGFWYILSSYVVPLNSTIVNQPYVINSTKTEIPRSSDDMDATGDEDMDMSDVTIIPKEVIVTTPKVVPKELLTTTPIVPREVVDMTTTKIIPKDLLTTTPIVPREVFETTTSKIVPKDLLTTTPSMVPRDATTTRVLKGLKSKKLSALAMWKDQ